MSTKVIKGILLVIALFAIGMAFVRFNKVTLPEGAVPVVWDGEVCGHCKMHVGDPRFAAQLQTTAGDVLNFDDPGCLFDYLQSHEVSVHALYFRNYDEDGWLTESEAGFPPGRGFSHGVWHPRRPEGHAGSPDVDWAKGQVINRPDHPHGGS